MNKENILEIDNLERSYSTVMPDGETKVYSVLRGISFQVKRGEFIGIMGSSGCGKTTLLKTIGMLNKPNGGRVLYNGEDTTEIYGDHLAEIRRTQLAFVFQDFYLMNSLTVRENIMMPLILNEDDPVESSKTAETMAEKLGIYKLLDKKPYELSGGEKQRTAICRASREVRNKRMNGGIYSTGNEIVDENAKLNISGNIIPQVWYRTIIRESGKPNLTAIIILADIVYWYKPTEIRDEGTGQVIGVRKKFKSDLLQRSYQQISEQFGISKKEATNAVVFLEKLGVVKRVFRTISMNGIVVNNVLYLELIVDRLKELTYPEETGADPVSFEKRREKSKAEKISSHTAIEEEIHFVEERAVPFQRERVSPFKEGAYPDRETEPWIPKEVPQTDSGQTNTEITTKTTAESTQKNTTEIGNGYRDNPILSYQAAEEQFKDQIDYDAIWIDRPFDRKLLDEIVGLAVDVLTSNAKTIRVNQEERPLGIVQGMYKKLDKFTVEYVIDSIKQCTRKANNIRAVLLTALYNATLTANSYISNLFAYQEAIPQT